MESSVYAKTSFDKLLGILQNQEGNKMKFYIKKINGVYLIEPELFIDNRGVYRRHFCQRELKAHSIPAKVAQANIVESKTAFTLRGFHYQEYPYEEGKILSCIKGAIYDIVVDIRPKSPTYLKWVAFELDENNKKSVSIPPGCAHATLTLQDNTIVHYYSTQFYHPESERGIRYNDPLFKFNWPHEPSIISEKDKNHPNFSPKNR